MHIRPVQDSDVDELLQAEVRYNYRDYDDEFQFKAVNPWALRRSDLMELISRRDEPQKGVAETRTYAVEAEDWTCGGFSVELLLNSLDVCWLCVHPGRHWEGAVKKILGWLKDKADSAKKRRQARLWLRDRKEAGLEEYLPLVEAAGFAVKLERDYFGSHDGWRCTYEASGKVEEEGDTLTA